MRIQFPNFESGVRNTTILYRGRDMYHEGSVNGVYSRGANSWEFEVSSAYSHGVSYDVNIRVQDGRVAYKNCTCPYDRTSLCKHMVACFYVIRARNLLGGGDVDGEEEDESGEYEDYDDDDDGYYYNNDDDEEDDDEDEEEEEEEEEVNNSMEIDRIIKERKVAKEMKEAKVVQDQKEAQKHGKTEIMAFKKVGEDFVENEFHCQVCLEVMDDPVLMPCSAHSMCYDCALMMFKHKNKEPDGHRLLSCPTCGEASGAFRFKNVKDIKINLEMKRIKEAYDNERRAWSQEKETLQEIVSQVKPQSEASEKSEDSEESEESEDFNKSKKFVKTKEKGCVIDKEIEQMEDVKKLQEVAGKILIKLKSKGVKLDSFVEKILKQAEGGKTTEEKSKRLKRKAEDSNKENTETEDRYPLRSLKRTKTTGL